MNSLATPSTERLALVVDDEPVVCRMAAHILRDAGFRVLEAHDGQEAEGLLTTLDHSAIGLVVSDISMPRMTGVQLAAIIMDRWPGIAVLLMTGGSELQASYAGPCLQKPFRPEALLAAVALLVPAVESLSAPLTSRFPGVAWRAPAQPSMER